MSVSVALMLKAPRAGQVKTRLARTIGTEKATQIYRRLVEHQIRQIPADWVTQIHFAPANAADEMQHWLGSTYDYCPQPDGDLGHRLSIAMQAHFAQCHLPLVFLGADCPYLTTSHFAEVGALLIETEAVLIPALDGGYCLLALRQPTEQVFHGITWNSDAVANETRQRFGVAGISWKELPALEDVDDEPSWTRAKLVFPGLDG